MSHVLPLPHRSSLAVPLAALAIGAAGGAAAGVIVADDGVSVPGPAPAAQVDVPRSTPPVPERVTGVSAPSAASVASPAPVPERVTGVSAPSSTPVASPAPIPERVASSLSGTTSSNTPVTPERISGMR